MKRFLFVLLMAASSGIVLAQGAAVPGPASYSDIQIKEFIAQYTAQLAVESKQRIRMPAEVIASRKPGEVRVSLSIGANGKIAGTEISKSTVPLAMEKSLRHAVIKAKPFVKIPKALEGRAFVASFVFRLQ